VADDIVDRLREEAGEIMPGTFLSLEGPAMIEAADEIERLRTALGLACELLSTYYAMSPPDQLMQQFLEEARRV